MLDADKHYRLTPGRELLQRARGPLDAVDDSGLGTLQRYPAKADSIPQPAALCFENQAQPQYSASLCERPMRLKTLYLPVVNGARLLGPGIVIARNGQILSESVGRHVRKMGLEPAGDETFSLSAELRSAVRRAQTMPTPVHECTGLMLFDPAIHRFGMWLLKCLPKLSVLRLLDDPDVKVVIPNSLPDMYVNLMLDLGIPADRVVFHDPSGVSEFRRLIVPPKMYTINGCRYGNPFEVFSYPPSDEQRAGSVLQVPGQGVTRVFVSRRGNKRRRLANEQAVEQLFADSGFEIVETSRLTASQRVSLFSSCELVAGAAGSGLYQLLFSRRQVRALALVPPEEKFDKAFLTLGHVCAGKGGRVGYVFGRMAVNIVDSAREFDYSWEIDLDHLQRALAALIGTPASR